MKRPRDSTVEAVHFGRTEDRCPVATLPARRLDFQQALELSFEVARRLDTLERGRMLAFEPAPAPLDGCPSVRVDVAPVLGWSTGNVGNP
jgi:hypothetical protein